MAQTFPYEKTRTTNPDGSITVVVATGPYSSYSYVIPAGAPPAAPPADPPDQDDGGGDDTGGGPAPTPESDPETANRIEAVRLQNPWIELLGLWGMVEEALMNAEPWELIYAKVQQTDQYKQMFAGMMDSRGQRRYANERQYLDELNRYRQVLQQFGAFDPQNDDPADYVGFITAGITPDELGKRFQLYKDLERGSQGLRDAFYVYAGMDVSVDDLYKATVSTDFREAMTSEYNQKVAGSKLDYETFITRATERGLQRAVEALGRMKTLGLLTGQAVAEMQAVDPNFAREMMGALFTGGGAQGAKQLSLDELIMSFQYAMIGSAAGEQGLEMPTLERIEQLRSAGVDRARAMQAYGAFAGQKSALSAMAKRSNVLDDFDQEMFEDAVLLARGDAQMELRRITGQEAALGRQQGTFQQRITDDGRLEQVGRRI